MYSLRLCLPAAVQGWCFLPNNPMRVLLISPNEEILPDPVFPLGLAFLAGTLQKEGHEYRVLDFCANPQEGLLGETIKQFNPEAVCISLRNIDNVAYPHSTSYFPQYKKLCHHVRKLTDSPTIIGGAGFSLFPERLLQELEADFGIVGSGEKPLIELLQALSNKTGFADIPNLLVQQNVSNTDFVSKNLPLPKILPSHQGFPLDVYYKLGGMANVQTKRGCSFNCSYCSYPLIEGKVTKTRPVEDVLAEIRGLIKAGFDEIYFVDSVFNQPVDYAKELCRAIIDAGLKIRWTCYGSPLGIDEEMVMLFKKSGCIGIEFGTDALSPDTLKGLGKSFTVEDVEKASLLCAKHDLPFCHAILAGGPGETKETFHETVERLAALHPTAVVFMTGIRIIPGTKLYELAIQEKIITEKTDMLEPVFYLSKTIQPVLEKEVKKLSRKYKNWIFPGHSIRSSPLLAKKLRQKGVRGPLWLNLAKKIR